MELRHLMRDVRSHIDGIAFDDLWPGFDRFPFALYNDVTVMLEDRELPYTKDFIGNTAIQWNGSYLAIWQVDGTEDAVDLAAGITHEMFHAFQYARGETRFPQDLKMLACPENVRNLSLKLEENRLLAESFDLPSIQQRQALGKIAAIRRQRKELLGDFFVGELYSETAEGMAEYVGMCARRKISSEMYKEKLKHCCARLSTGEYLFDTRRCSYDSGALLLLACERVGVGFYHEIGKETRPVYYIMEEQLPNAQAPVPRVDISERAELFYQEKRRRFDQFFIEASVCTEGDFCICGYDPMNMERCGKRVLCKHCIMLSQNGESQFIEGPVGLILKEGSDFYVTAYCKNKK